MVDEQPQANPEILIKLVTTKMPYGKYKDSLLCDLPMSYLEWFARKGFPKGGLGISLQTIYENGVVVPAALEEGEALVVG